MNARIIVPVLAVVLITLGILLQQDPYRLRDPGQASDQHVLAHRDSIYTHISWVTSQSHNYAQLRFYDKVEGGVCLEPSWDQLAGLSPQTLGHLAMPTGRDNSGAKPAKSWPEGKAKPNMGTLTNTKYICMYPTAVLLNQRLMAEAGGDPRKATPNILIVGLGSGVGVGMFAHHFPEASITVVDIDQAVIDMVYEHYPLLDWLAHEAPPTSDGRKRLRMIAADARKAVIYPTLHGSEREFDVVVLDAYTSGSTIPPHLMTKEFYQELKGAMTEDGIVLSNIIGSYRKEQRRLLGGAMRSMMAAGLESVHSFPIYYYLDKQTKPLLGFDEQGSTRNNIVLASAQPLDPAGNRSGWELLRNFLPFNDLPLAQFRSVYAVAYADGKPSMAASLLDESGQAIDGQLMRDIRRAYNGQPEDMRFGFGIPDSDVVKRAVSAVRTSHGESGRAVPDGWDRDNNSSIGVVFIDWVLHARRTWQASVELAEEKVSLTHYLHSGRHLAGPPEDERDGVEVDWLITDAPLFTDSKPNADIMNH